MDVQNNKNKRVIVEQLSYIHFTETDGRYVLHDALCDVKYDINRGFYYVCQQIDGARTAGEIAATMSADLGVPEEDAQKAVDYVIKVLKKRGLALIKGSVRYYYVKWFYLLTGYKHQKL